MSIYESMLNLFHYMFLHSMHCTSFFYNECIIFRVNNKGLFLLKIMHIYYLKMKIHI
jgi:hypothetical protein